MVTTPKGLSVDVDNNGGTVLSIGIQVDGKGLGGCGRVVVGEGITSCTGNVGLEELVLVSLNERLSKEVEARLSKWSSKELSEKQKTYAALDAKKSLELYRHLLKLPDLTVRLMIADATEGRAIDIVPKSGNVACMATRAGWGKIVNGRYTKSPAKITPAKVRPSDNSRIVQVDSVAAPHLIVPGMKTEKGDRACLGNFGEPPFQVVLPLQMMRDHVKKARVLPMNTPDVEDSESGALTPPAAASVPAASTNRQPSSNENEEDADIDADADVDILSFDDDAQMPVLSADDIEYLRLVALEADETTSGRTPLECPDLDPPPDPKHIANNHSAVLGDGFHAIYRPIKTLNPTCILSLPSSKIAFLVQCSSQDCSTGGCGPYLLFTATSSTARPDSRYSIRERGAKPRTYSRKSCWDIIQIRPVSTSTRTFGTWHTGVEMSDCLMAERRHRFNHRCSERRRLDFPILGHYDTWLVDLLQTLVLKNHGVLLYPSWSNTSDYKDTPESFGTVALHSEELASAVESFTPVNDPKEIKLFARLELDSTVPKDDDALSVEWCKYVDGINIFPKLPVHFRNYRERFERNQRVRDAVKRAREGAQMLNNLNAALAPATDEDSGSAQEQTSASSAPEESANALNTPTRPIPADPAVATAAWPIPQLPQPMRLPHSAARHNNPVY